MINKFFKIKAVANCVSLSIVCAFAIVPAFIGSDAKAQTKFTQEEILKLPDGVLNDVIYPLQWQDNENVLLLKYGKERTQLLYNLKSGVTTPVEKREESKVVSAALERFKTLNNFKEVRNYTFSPDSSMIAYTRADNNLYLYDVASGVEKAVTSDGTKLILNGWASWVYYEEILGRSSRYKAFWWSPDSKTLAYYKFDDTKVPMFPIYDSRGKAGFITETHYPKAGDNNPTVKIGFVETGGFVSKTTEQIAAATVWADFNSLDDQYFGIPFWNAEGTRMMIPWMPREQNNLIIFSVNPVNGSKEKIYNEVQKSWIDWPDQMVFTADGFYMIRDFEMWEQIYFQSFDGKRLEKITEGRNWGVNILKLDQKGKAIYFTARREISTRNDFYKVDLKTKKITRLSTGPYNFTNVYLSPDNKHFIARYSNSETPTRVGLFTIGKKGTDVKVLYDLKGEKFDQYKIAKTKMLYMNVDGFTIPAEIILPIDMDSTKKYPVIVSIYGGPNSGTVMDTWRGVGEGTQWWANEGVIQVAMDHRAAGHCGKEGVNAMYRSFVTVELADYIAWMKELYKRPYVNREKVGITGFSFGGTVTSTAVIRYGNYFPYGIAGGGVYDYILYDSHYTERYMDSPKDNPAGYKNTCLMDFVSSYKGDSTNYLKITHGTSDDNVHMQNAMQLINALQNAGKQFDLMLYPGEFHGYRGMKGLHSNQGDYLFWYNHLLGKEAPIILLRNEVKKR